MVSFLVDIRNVVELGYCPEKRLGGVLELTLTGRPSVWVYSLGRNIERC